MHRKSAIKEPENFDFRRQCIGTRLCNRCGSTSAVDTATDAKIRKAFAEEIPNTTKLIIAQRISSVMNADRIIVLNNGVVDGFGSHEELMETNAIYREVYESQTQGSGDFDEGGAK